MFGIINCGGIENDIHILTGEVWKSLHYEKARSLSEEVFILVEESYRRMVNPACQEVDASPSKEEVLKTVLQLIKKHCAL
uniref:Uncharacterized protein n=1 Tax=Bubo bubo TaxID=30461 RepID=A0A8C0F4U9_BUBBB